MRISGGVERLLGAAAARSGSLVDNNPMSKANGKLRVFIYGEYFLSVLGGVQTAMNFLAKGLVDLNSRKGKGCDQSQIEMKVATRTAANGMDDSIPSMSRRSSAGILEARQTDSRARRDSRRRTLLAPNGDCPGLLASRWSWITTDSRRFGRTACSMRTLSGSRSTSNCSANHSRAKDGRS